MQEVKIILTEEQKLQIEECYREAVLALKQLAELLKETEIMKE